MKKLLPIVVLAVSARCYSADASQIVDLRAGTIELLPGYSHEPKRGIDSTPGTISSADGKLLIRYDIGKLAGYQMHPTRRTACSWYREQSINNRKACLGLIDRKNFRIFIATIYSSPTETTGEPANFSAVIRSQNDIADVLLMLCTFKAKGRK